MTSALGRSVRRWGLVAAASPPTTGTLFATKRSLSVSFRRLDDDQKRPHPAASDEANHSSSSSQQLKESNDAVANADYQPPSSPSGAWPFDSASNSADSAQVSSDADSSSSTPSPYAGLFEGDNPFPKASVPKLGASSDSASEDGKSSWLSDQLDALATSSRSSRSIGRSDRRNPNAVPPEERGKNAIPRSVLFADDDAARQSDDFRPRKPSSAARKRLDRTPLTKQEANAFMSMLNEALAGTSTPSSSAGNLANAAEGAAEHTPFGSYTSLISNPKTQSGSKALLQAFAKRNRLQRFEEARAQRAKRFVREGLAAQIDPLQLEAGIDEARERIAMCENLVELMEWAKKDVWGIDSVKPPPQDDAAIDPESSLPSSTSDNEPAVGPQYGKDTPYYSAVIHLLFVAIRDRYRAPHVALSVARVTRSLGIESYVLGVTGSLYNEVLKTQWEWLGDLQGVVTTLRQARETGILSAPIKHAAAPSGLGVGTSGRSNFATSEDETIRETVDRIANEVRKYVLDQQMASDPDFKRDYLYASDRADVLGGGEAQEATRVERTTANWSHKWLLANAEEATSLAGQPFRLLQRQRRTEGGRAAGDSRSHGSSGNGGYRGTYSRGSGGADRHPSRASNNSYQPRSDVRSSPSRYAPASYNSRTPKSNRPSESM